MRMKVAAVLLAVILAAPAAYAQFPQGMASGQKPAAKAGQKQGEDHPKPQLFLRMDENGDGLLTLEEIQKAFPGFTQEKFNSIDTNHDGKVSKEEWQAYVTGIRTDPQNKATPGAAQ